MTVPNRTGHMQQCLHVSLLSILVLEDISACFPGLVGSALTAVDLPQVLPHE